MASFAEIKAEVKRRALRNESGSEYDTAIANAVNSSLFRTARDAKWKVLRRESTFDTEIGASGNSATVSNGSSTIGIVGVELGTDNNAIPGQILTLGNSNLNYRIEAITDVLGSSIIVIDKAYDGNTGTVSWTLLPKEEYSLPIQASYQTFLWHEQFGYPHQLTYIPEQEFRSLSVDDTQQDIPTHYRMWGESMTVERQKTSGIIDIESSDAGDTAIDVTIFGNVGGYPDSETVTTDSNDGRTDVSTTKSFSKIDRVVKHSKTIGRINVKTNSGDHIISVIPAGNVTDGILYKRVQLWPLPNAVFPIHCVYYKEPFAMVNNNDVHELGEQFDEAIILLATAKLRYESSQKEGDRYISLWKDEVASLRRVNVDKMDWLPQLKKARESTRRDRLIHPSLSYRQLGGNFGPRGYR